MKQTERSAPMENDGECTEPFEPELDAPSGHDFFEEAEPGFSPVNLYDEIDGEDGGLPPPEEENEAREMNAGMVFAVIFIGVAVILLIVMLAGGKKGRKKSAGELDKAGSKYEVEFRERPAETVQPSGGIPQDDSYAPEEKDDVDDILATLPKELQPQESPGTAPVSPVGSGSRSAAARSDRPDTRNSKSPRRIDGLKGQASPDTNANIVSAVMNGGFMPDGSSGRMSKEEYIAQMMRQTQAVQNSLYGGTGSGSAYGQSGGSQQAYQQNREGFYSDGTGGGGSGEFLSYSSLWDGTVISGALVTAINTDNPGVVIARVTENVYSSYDHSFLLIPEGSLLYATYNSSVSYGQDKVQVAWNLLIRPDGYRLSLGNMNGVSAQGASGYKGRVNNHPWETLKALGMIAVYSMIQTDMSKSINSQNNEYIQNAMTDVWAQSSKIGNRMIDRALDIKPTITIKAGTEIKLITNTPLELPPARVNQATRKYIRTR